MRFQKGQSGNPGGRPKELQGIQDLARTHCPEAIKTLAAVCKSGKSEAARVTAAIALMDRGYGRPPQFLTGDPARFRRASELTDEELADIIGGEPADPDNRGGEGPKSRGLN